MSKDAIVALPSWSRERRARNPPQKDIGPVTRIEHTDAKALSAIIKRYRGETIGGYPRSSLTATSLWYPSRGNGRCIKSDRYISHGDGGLNDGIILAGNGIQE